MPWKLAVGGSRVACGRERFRLCRELAALRCAESSIVLQEPLETTNVPPTPPLAGFLCLAAKLHHVKAEDLSPRPHVSMCCCLVGMLEHASCNTSISRNQRKVSISCTSLNCPAALSLLSYQYCPHQTYHPNHLDCWIMMACTQAKPQ